MAIRDWPRAERPREKLLDLGAAALSDAELLAIFLQTGVQGQSAVDVARQLLQHCGSLRALLELENKQFCALPGMGPARFSLLQSALEITRRHLRQGLQRGSVMSSPQATRDYLRSCLRTLPREVFVCLYLDSQHALIQDEQLFAGTLDGAAVYPREVVRRCLQLNCAAVIFAHNHPSGLAEPSQADRLITQRLVEALNLIDVRVLDHLVIGDPGVSSFAELGYL